MARRTAAETPKTGQTVKRENDGKIHATLSDGTIVILRDAIGRDMQDVVDDDYLMLTRLIIQWGDRVREGNRSPIMSDELRSKGFVSLSDAVFLKKIIRKIFNPDMEKVEAKTEIKDLGKDGLEAVLPSGLKIKLNSPDGYDLEQCELPTDGDMLKTAIACNRLAALTSVQWGNKSGDPAIDFEETLDLSVSDFLAVAKAVSETFFRVATVDL